MLVPAIYKVTLKLFGTFQVIYFLCKLFEYFEYGGSGSLHRSFKLAVLINVLFAAVTAIRSVNYMTLLDQALFLRDFELVVACRKKARTWALSHIIFVLTTTFLLFPQLYKDYRRYLQSSEAFHYFDYRDETATDRAPSLLFIFCSNF